MSFSQAGFCAPSPPATDQIGVYRWSPQCLEVRIAFSGSGGNGPSCLLLQALTTVSNRREWHPFREILLECQSLVKAHHVHQELVSADTSGLIRPDWRGFGESERQHLQYGAVLLAHFLVDVRRDCCPDDCGLIAAGIALLVPEPHGLTTATDAGGPPHSPQSCLRGGPVPAEASAVLAPA